MRVPSFEIARAVRRSLFIGGSILLTAIGLVLLLRSYNLEPLYWPDYIVFALFPFLFSQIAMGFLLSVFGYFDLLRGGDPLHLMRRPGREAGESSTLAATAIVIPIFNEEVERVAKGVENMWRSLAKTGEAEYFDIYLCSDSTDPDHWIEEECAWLHLCRKLDGFGKIFYRRRRRAINGKSGNVADFCRRWGKRYRYMILLDADSIMSGPTMVRMIRTMEANPEVGILQSLPSPVLGRSLFRRMLQFSSAAYGKTFAQGCSFVQMSSGSYWGHNAAIRMTPFIEYCDLPRLPVPDARRRHLLSHDTVEAALMGRGGYEVWMALQETGSYEEGPPNLSDMLVRDRRWCAGNLQHFWILFARGIDTGNRLLIWNGLMAYLCSPLWLIFLIAGSFGGYERARFFTYSAGPADFGAEQYGGTLLLLLFTLALLFLPRVFGILSRLSEAVRFGGWLRLLGSAVAETLLSTLMAPVLMLFHTLFVLQALLGWQVKWTTQNRADAGLSFSHCLKLYGWQSVLGIAAQAIAWDYLGWNACWLIPIFVAWIFAPLTAWLSSGPCNSSFTRSLFAISEESEDLPEELAGLSDVGDQDKTSNSGPLWPQAILCPYVQAVHLSMARRRSLSKESGVPLSDAGERLASGGPDALRPKEILLLLGNPAALLRLRKELWSRPDACLHPSWKLLQSQAARNPLMRYLVSH